MNRAEATVSSALANPAEGMRHAAVVGAVALLAAMGAGCLGDEGPANPIETEPPAISDPVLPGDVRRVVEVRNPLGGRLGNLLVDGDFELSIIIQGSNSQSGWLAFGNGQGYLRGATGGVCRSGLRCGWLEPQVLLFGQGAAAKDSGMIATLWAKPPAGSACSSVQVQVLRCNTFASAANLILQSEDPGPDGWCFYRGRVKRQTTATCMLIESSLADQSVLVDDAAIVPDTGTTPLSLKHAIPDISFRPLHGERRERVRKLVDWRRKRMKFTAPLQDRARIGLK